MDANLNATHEPPDVTDLEEDVEDAAVSVFMMRRLKIGPKTKVLQSLVVLPEGS